MYEPTPTIESVPGHSPAPEPVSGHHGEFPPSARNDLEAIFGGRGACPTGNAAEQSHCVWIVPSTSSGAVDLAKKMKALGFDAEAEPERGVFAYWTPAQLEKFFSKPVTWSQTGGGSGGMVCIATLPDDAAPPPELRKMIERWIVDDPVCEL